MRACYRNSSAANFNSRLNQANSKLAPFYSHVTGELLEGTLITVKEVDQMPAARVNELLVELGLSTRGNASAKKRRLKWNLGLYDMGDPEEYEGGPVHA
ncbi:hypothetical protein E4U53_001704 [Claviceps sorghi]|nr:hypothetical protein E4U53_001704 [Claviceps sorghi]